MNWDEIHDPTHEIDFNVEWTLVSNEYLPEEIQKLIDDKGVLEMVRVVNEHFKLKTGSPALMLGHVGNRKSVM